MELCLHNACSGALGLVDRVLPSTQEVEGLTPTGGTCLNDPTDQDIRTQCALSWKVVVSEWRSVIAVSVNVGGGVRLIKPVHVHANTLQTQRGRTHGTGCVRIWFRTAEPLGERRYENWNTHTRRVSVHVREIIKYMSGKFML